MLGSKTVTPYEVFDLERITDPNGSLYVAEIGARFGASFSRIYFITGVPAGAARGGHAHKEQAECLICVQGSLVVRIETGDGADVISLERPGRALYLPCGYWRDLIEFSPNTILAVLSAAPFDENDYIRDRAAFRRWEAATS
jgi:uncharacterized RmlC-like cupin family protein